MQGSYVEDSSSRDELLARNERLEKELARCREDAQRIRSLFNSMAAYAQKAREGAQRDFDIDAHEDSTEAERLAAATSDLERTEQELDRARQELARLRALTADTRTRLSTFMAARLDALTPEQTERTDEATPARDLDEAPHEWLASTDTVTAGDRTHFDH